MRLRERRGGGKLRLMRIAAGPAAPTKPDILLTLIKATGSDHVAVAIPASGGVIGRAGDFSPEVFSERVSGVHANITVSDTCWEIEHLGRIVRKRSIIDKFIYAYT